MVLYVYTVPSTTAPVRGQLFGFIRTMCLQNLSATAGAYIDVTFDTGENFRVGPSAQLILHAEDCSADNNAGKLCSNGITITGNGVFTVAINCNYTFYSLRERGQKIEVR